MGRVLGIELWELVGEFSKKLLLSGAHLGERGPVYRYSGLLGSASVLLKVRPARLQRTFGVFI